MKKKIITGIFVLLFASFTIAQAPPQGVNYQAVAFDNSAAQLPGTDPSSLVLINQEIKVRFTIIKDQASGTEIYKEEHYTMTDNEGLFNLIIGQGTQLSASSFPQIDWGTGLHFLKVEVDIKNGYKNMGTQQIWSVPYALYTEKAGNGVMDMVDDGTSLTLTLENGDVYNVPLGGGTGTQGPAGPQGPQGPQGPAGANGATGPAGATGPQGPQGPQGPAGTNGAAGVNGINSLVNSTAETPGANCLNGGFKIDFGMDTNGNGILEASEITSTEYVCNGDGSGTGTGPQGPEGPEGPQGPAGADGAIGPQGPVGPAGANGTNGNDGISIEWLGTNATAPTSPTINQAYYNSTDGVSYIWDGSSWQIVAQDGTGGGPSGPHNTLNQAYNEGGPGAGRIITANNGAVEINHTGTGTRGLNVTTNQNSSFAIDATNSGTGVAIRARNTNAANTFASLQAETNSTNTLNSAILGSNSGAGYGVSGQIPATATGTSAVYGNNLRTNGGSGVRGEGYNGVVGISSKIDGFGVYGSNTGPYDATNTYPTAGVYGIGVTGIYGQTTDVTNGWAGYFTRDIGVEGAGISLEGWFDISDSRLKSNITPISSALEKIAQLSGNSYTLKTPKRDIDGNITMHERVQYGVIAQEVQAIFPEMISENAVFRNLGDETVYKTVKYNELIPVLIEAIKELKDEVDALKLELQNLKD